MRGRLVLIADDDADFLTALAQRCKALGLSVQVAADGLAALATIVREDPDLVILDIDMPAVGGIDVAQKLLGDPTLRPIRVIFCTGQSDPATIERCKALGAHYVTKGADAWPQLKTIICQVLAMSDDATEAAPEAPTTIAPAAAEPPPAALPKVLFVDDDADMRRVMQIRLRACGIDVHAASTAMQALWIAMKEVPDVIITDYHMPEGSGQYLLGRLKGTPMLKDIPVIMLTGARIGNDRDFALERRFLGEYRAAAFLSKPVDLDVLLGVLSDHIAIDPEVARNAAKLRRR
ncbi:MAG TPA: response regulator [Candidatus Acidoferrum sp.]|nr:response regulator [Candidatus Acidoferrum sp.]